MTIRLRTAFFISLGAFIVWFLYLEREILTPFVLAGIFAYIINPLVNFLSHKIRLPRGLSVVIIYILILGLATAGSIALSKAIIAESSEIDSFINSLVSTVGKETSYLPDFLRVPIQDALFTLSQSKLSALSPSLLTLFPKAISGIVSFVIFLFSGFFFLKEGKGTIDRFLNLVPNAYRIEVEILLRKINTVFGGYLRGQLILIAFVSTILFAALSFLGIKFALVLAVFSGFSEIVPFIGPIVAGAVSSAIAFVTVASNYDLNQIQLVLIVIIIYFIVRQIEDYFVTPYIMGKVTKLHPLVILFAVLSGGHIAGILGLMLAVPVAAIIRILWEYLLNKVNESSEQKKLLGRS